MVGRDAGRCDRDGRAPQATEFIFGGKHMSLTLRGSSVPFSHEREPELNVPCRVSGQALFRLCPRTRPRRTHPNLNLGFYSFNCQHNPEA